MACHAIRHDPALSPPYPVDSIHGMGAPGVGGGETMNPVLIGIAVAILFLAPIAACLFAGMASRRP